MTAPAVLRETERLTLRRFTPADADDLRALDADPEVVRYTNAGLTGGGRPSRADAVSQLERFIARYADCTALAFWAAEDRATAGRTRRRDRPNRPTGNRSSRGR